MCEKTYGIRTVRLTKNRKQNSTEINTRGEPCEVVPLESYSSSVGSFPGSFRGVQLVSWKPVVMLVSDRCPCLPPQRTAGATMAKVRCWRKSPPYDCVLVLMVCGVQIVGTAILFMVFTTSHGLMTLYEPDYDALMDVYIFANGAEWIDRTNWKRGDPCDPTYPWYGVTCMYDELYQRYRVSEVRERRYRLCCPCDVTVSCSQIRLSANNLRGHLRPSLGRLHKLT
jgi:hypothetical protein